MLKFRVWDVKNKKMYDNVHSIEFSDFGGNTKVCKVKVIYPVYSDHDKSYSMCSFGLDDFILMQCSNVSDVRAQDIYEGDIICNPTKPSEAGTMMFGAYESNGELHTGFYIQRANDNKDWKPNDYGNKLFRIIGDIYRNPELINIEYENKH